MELEFVALTKLGNETEWTRDLLYEIPLGKKVISLILILGDGQATLTWAYSDIYNEKSRHMNLKHKYVRKLIEYGTIFLTYVKSSELSYSIDQTLTIELVRSTSTRMMLNSLSKSPPMMTTLPDYTNKYISSSKVTTNHSIRR